MVHSTARTIAMSEAAGEVSLVLAFTARRSARGERALLGRERPVP